MQTDVTDQAKPAVDARQLAEAAGVRAFLERGDVAGAQQFREFTLQTSRAESNQFLMQAHRQLSAGDVYGAAQSLAEAHAFFPDSTTGQFIVDNNDKLWSEHVDGHDPTRLVGRPFRITPNGILALFNQTTDPQQYLARLRGFAR